MGKKIVSLFCFTLFMICTVTLTTAAVNTLDDLEKIYRPSETCGKCHADIYEQWRMSLHDESLLHSLDGISSYVINGIGKESHRKNKSLKAEVMKCLNCHAPMMEDASDRLVKEVVKAIKTAVNRKADDRSKREAKAKLSRLNVSCYVCHNMKAVHPPDKPEKNTMYGLKGTEKSPYHSIKKGRFLDNAIFCMQCHGVYTAPDREKIICSTISQSYRDQYVADGGQEKCQDCHMRKKNRGHSFPGAYVLDTLRDSMELKVHVRKIKDQSIGVRQWLPAAAITVDLTNNAGHRIPDGCKWSSKVVMEITAKDEKGTLVWSAEKEFFQPALDIEGNRSYDPWKVKDILDFTLPPRKTTTEKYYAVFPEKTRNIKLEVKVRYIHKKGVEFLVHGEKRTLEYK